MYSAEEMPEKPSDDQVAQAVGILISQAMHMEGAMMGLIYRNPEPGTPGRSFVFQLAITDVTDGIAVEGAPEGATVQ